MLKLITPEPSAAPAEPHALRYWAFLSYSHHDKLIAKRLQRQLETYRLPRRLVGRETSVGPVPARATPVFRDRDELHAGADLKASVQEALSRSRWLIVVCTPDAARSPWVNREIIEFKRLRGERHVLALIARGEPFASDMPGREAEECFPPALRRALTPEGLPEGEPLEPIAADMRKHGDGPQRAMLKLLAGMVGVGFDDLVRRDMQRRVRLLSAVAGASVLGVMGFALLAVMAVQARNEAQHQRVQAEGLIEFMLGDLRKKLEPVGRLEVLDSVGEKALAYYGSQEASRLDARALGHRSRAMHLIGEIRDLRGNPAEAQAAFEQAATTTAQLLAKSPNDGQRIFDHAQSVFWVGYAAWKRADGVAAQRWFSDYLSLALRLRDQDPLRLDWAAEVAFAHLNLGTVQLRMGQPSQALASLTASGALLLELSKRNPALQFELANNLGWEAEANALAGDYHQALDKQRRKLELFEAMPGGQKNKTARRGALNSLYKLSRYQLAQGRLGEAEQSVSASLKIAEELVNEDPENQLWRSDACVAWLSLTDIQRVAGRSREAQRSFQRATGCLALLDAAGTIGFYESVVLKSRFLVLAAAMSSDHESKRVEVQLRQLLDEYSPKVKSDTPDGSRVAIELANAALALGDLRERLRSGDAQFAWHQAEVLLVPFLALNEGELLTALAKARLHLGDEQGAAALAGRVQGSTYRHPGYADLQRKLQTARGGSKPFVNQE